MRFAGFPDNLEGRLDLVLKCAGTETKLMVLDSMSPERWKTGTDLKYEILSHTVGSNFIN